MTTVCRHNDILQQRLTNLIVAGDAKGLQAALQGLSNKDARTAGYLLGEVLLPQYAEGERFWALFLHLVPAQPKAYLGTFLKAAVTLYGCGRIAFSSLCLTEFSAHCSPVDREKFLKACLPILRTPHEAQGVLQAFGMRQDKRTAAYLLHGGSAVCYYLLFKTLKVIEDEGFLRDCCRTLMLKGDARSFNLASIVCHYFDLKDVPGVFSLRMEPYKLNRLDKSFESFLDIIQQ